MGRNTSVSLGNYFESFVDNKIIEGRFKNASEVIRAGLRLLESEEYKVTSLKNAIAEGIESGVAYDFDSAQHLKSLKLTKPRLSLELTKRSKDRFIKLGIISRANDLLIFG